MPFSLWAAAALASTAPVSTAGTSTAVASTAVAAATDQDRSERNGVPAAVADVTDCRRVEEAGARLRCFDGASARLAAAIDGNQITLLDREGVRRTRRSLFGFSLPAVGIFGVDRNGPEEVVEVDSVVSRVLPLVNGRFELVLADGARWQTTEPMRWDPAVGAKVHIHRATLGSYWIEVERTRAVRGRRVG